MRVLFEEVENIYIYVKPTILITWVTAILVLLFFAIWLIDEKNKDYIGPFVGIMDAIIFVAGLIIITTTTSPGPIIHYVCFDNSDSFENHSDEYELVERKGDLYIIKDKE